MLHYSDNYLEHSVHKYVAKEFKNGHYVYIYDDGKGASSGKSAKPVADVSTKNTQAVVSKTKDVKQKESVSKKESGNKKELSNNYDVKKVQKVVNKIINGDYGNGSERQKKLKKAGYDYVAMQSLVNTVWKRGNKTFNNTAITEKDIAANFKDYSGNASLISKSTGSSKSTSKSSSTSTSSIKANKSSGGSSKSKNGSALKQSPKSLRDAYVTKRVAKVKRINQNPKKETNEALQQYRTNIASMQSLINDQIKKKSKK